MKTRRRNRLIKWGIFWIVLGAIIFAAKAEMIPFEWDKHWPLLLVLLGVYFVIKALVGSRATAVTSVYNEKTTHTLRGRTLKVRVQAKDADTPHVRINIPLRVIQWGAQFSGNFSSCIPENVRETLREKGIEIPEDICDNFETIFADVPPGERIDIVNVYDNDDGEHVHVYIE